MRKIQLMSLFSSKNRLFRLDGVRGMICWLVQMSNMLSICYTIEVIMSIQDTYDLRSDITRSTIYYSINCGNL